MGLTSAQHFGDDLLTDAKHPQKLNTLQPKTTQKN